MEMTRITAEVSAQTASLVEELARGRGISGAEFVADAVRRVVEHEAEFRAFVQEGVDAADSGQSYTQAEMEHWFEQRVAARAR